MQLLGIQKRHWIVAGQTEVVFSNDGNGSASEMVGAVFKAHGKPKLTQGKKFSNKVQRKLLKVFHKCSNMRKEVVGH